MLPVTLCGQLGGCGRARLAVVPGRTGFRGDLEGELGSLAAAQFGLCGICPAPGTSLLSVPWVAAAVWMDSALLVDLGLAGMPIRRGAQGKWDLAWLDPRHSGPWWALWRFLGLNIPCAGGCPVHCGVFSSIPGCQRHPLLIGDDQKCPHRLPHVPWVGMGSRITPVRNPWTDGVNVHEWPCPLPL